MPPPEPEWTNRLSRHAGEWSRRARVQSARLQSLLRAASSAEGRRHNLLPLMALCGAAGALVGLALGWRSHRRR